MNEWIEEGLKGMDLNNQILQQQPKKRVASGLEEIPSDRFVWKDLVIFFSFHFFNLWLPEKNSRSVLPLIAFLGQYWSSNSIWGSLQDVPRSN